MKKPDKHIFKLRLNGNPESRSIVRKEVDGKQTKFKAPITTKGIPKIYILKAKDKVVYIGYTSQSISSRFNGGLRAAGMNGYYGYQWKNLNELDLLVFCFEKFSDNGKTKKEEVQFVKAIEGELVFNVRLHSGRWPESQNEIHFFNNKKAKKLAAVIYHSLNEI
jgi:predicted GIY-YIG superfamily endonuclease